MLSNYVIEKLKFLQKDALFATGIVATVLQWRPFIPLSRLTYSIYLVNGIVILHSVASLRSPEYLSELNLVNSIFIITENVGNHTLWNAGPICKLNLSLLFI